MSFIASPEIVTALALAGRLSFNPLPRHARRARTGSRFDSSRRSPRAGGAGDGLRARALASTSRRPRTAVRVELRIDPASERLQRMEPWPAWDGRDFVDMPVLIKTQGKTTTDQISPAGPWLRYRGHLGPVQRQPADGRSRRAFSGETSPERRAARARDYRARGVRWVIVGDANYGEGSSREHAALSPRLLGGAAVIARSFARIHESNLKKQGLLALTFRDPADYERIREGDRVSLVGLAQLAPGEPVECHVEHADGTSETADARPLLQRVAARVVPRRLGAERGAESELSPPPRRERSERRQRVSHRTLVRRSEEVGA